MKTKFIYLVRFILLWMMLSLVFTFVFAPYKEIKENLFFNYKLYHLILLSFEKSFLASIISTGMALVFIVLGSNFARLIFRDKQRSLQALADAMNRSFRSAVFKSLSVLVVVLVGILNITVVARQVHPGPNILLIVVDTLRADYSAVGNETSTNTPYLKNHLMPDSLYFNKSFSNSPWTLPSVASLLTSQYPSKIGITNLVSRLDERHLTLAEILKDQGYSTCGIISHLLLKKNYGLDQGFDIYNEGNISEEFHNHYSISSPGVTEDAVRYIRKHKKKKFFLFLHYFDPHYMYLDHDKSMPYSGEFTSRDINHLRGLIRENRFEQRDIDYLKYCYQSEIKFTDSWIGKVIDELKTSGLYEKTLIVFTSDHGEEFLEKGWLGHSTTVYNEQIQIPLLIKLPVVQNSFPMPPPNLPVSNIDISPTVLHVLGVRPPRFLQGRDIFSPATEDVYIYSEVTQRDYGDFIDEACVISDEWKLIKNFIDSRFELYNLAEDANEAHNRIETEEETAQVLRAKMAKWSSTNRIKRKPQVKREALSDEEKEKLKSLGYIK